MAEKKLKTIPAIKMIEITSNLWENGMRVKLEDKVGRGAIIKKPLENSIHQNHIFRVRLDESELLPSFFAEYLQHQKAKRYFLGCAKQTTGIASINMRQLKALPVLLPPFFLQNEFATFAERVDQQKQTVQQSLDKLELMKKALMQEYFG